jgi:hypothetical protein
MSRDRRALIRESAGPEAPSGRNKSKFDLAILKYMTQKLLVTLHTRAQLINEMLPLYTSFEERCGRAHRMIIFTPQALLAEDNLMFIGFVSRRRKAIEQRIIDELFRVDQQMLDEIAHIPGLMSYSSLEWRAGNWYNLVVLRETAAKEHFRTMKTHRYAAYQLSPAYYEWIRLHNGSLPGGLAGQEMLLHSTKYYLFPEIPQPPTVLEVACEG